MISVAEAAANVTPVPAKFKGICRLCDEPFAKGDMILPVRQMKNRTRWGHVACVHAEATGTSVLAAPAEIPDEIRDKVEQIIRLEKRVEELEKNKPRVLEVHTPDADPRKVEGVTHPVFEEVVELAAARDNIFLPGPSGSGKSHLARQIADALGLKFGSISCSAGMSESQLLGRMVPMGAKGQFEFLGTQFLDCYENGGVFLFDEIDAADSNVLLVINSALANGHMSVPSRHENPVATRHPDFVCIAAANTWGRGADRQYVGRNELDESTIDRFRMGCVPVEYDESLERQLCPDDSLYVRLSMYRQNIQQNRLERIVSTRFIAQAYVKKHCHGWDDERIDRKLFQGWREDEVRKVKGGAS